MCREADCRWTCSCVIVGNTMRLYIGKNHRGHTAPVQSIFRLVGSDEDALTFALGFLLSRDAVFCQRLTRLLGVTTRKSFKLGYAVHLQEVTEPGFGRRDIVIEGSGTRIVIEAKIGDAEPSAEQLLKYGAEDDLWTQYATRVVVALTQVELSAATREKVLLKLAENGIQFFNVQWHDVFGLILSYRPSNDSPTTSFLFDEFIRYMRRDYHMGYHDAEISVQDVNPLNAIIYNEGWMYVTSLKDKKAPLYFAPYFTGLRASGITKISRVRDVATGELTAIDDVEDVVIPPTAGHLKHWRIGLSMLRERAEKEGFSSFPLRLLFLDRPIIFRQTALSKKAFKESMPSKQIPNQIPKGFHLGFDDLLLFPSDEIRKK